MDTCQLRKFIDIQIPRKMCEQLLFNKLRFKTYLTLEIFYKYVTLLKKISYRISRRKHSSN